MVSIFFILAYSHAQDYLWPTNSSTYLASSFCEFREGHYHSGIDIKTWLQEGYPCYAIEDGYIERIRVSPFGYGKVLYLRLKDGNTAVYAHLQRFTKKIDQSVRKRQLANQKYSLTWYPENYSVKKGEIIAYTGRTGIGVPHFHFEIRDKEHRPINPLSFYNQVRDNRRPHLEALAIIPISQNATINGSFLPQFLPLSYIKDGIYIVKDALKVKGKIGLAINGYDQADDVVNKYGFYQTTLYTAGEEIFKITYDKLSFATTSHIYTEIHYPLWINTGKVFHKLYIEPFNPLSFYTRYTSSDGTIQIKDRTVYFSIVISDYQNNQSIIQGELIPDNGEAISVEDIQSKDDWAYIKFNSPPFKEIQFFTGSNNNQLFFPVDYYEILEGKISNPKESILAKVNMSDSAHDLIKISMNTIEKQPLQRTISLSDSSYELNPDIHILGKNLILNFTKLYNKVCEINIIPDGKTVSMNYLHNGNAQALIPGETIESDTIGVQLLCDQKLLWFEHFDIAKIYPNMSINKVWFNSSLALRTTENAFLDTAIITANAYPSDSIQHILPAASDIYELYPSNIALFDKIDIQIKVDSLPFLGSWSIFRTDGSNSLSYLTTSYDSSTSIFRAQTNSLGKFVVACDTTPPYLEIISPQGGGNYSGNPQINLKLYDEHSDIGEEDNISLLLNGMFVLPEWDPEDNLVTAQFDQKLETGNHTLTVTVKDRCGNITRKAIYFTIN